MYFDGCDTYIEDWDGGALLHFPGAGRGTTFEFQLVVDGPTGLTLLSSGRTLRIVEQSRLRCGQAAWLNASDPDGEVVE